MKTIGNNEEQFNEIVFENRNKDYGAYALRTFYKKRMLIAMTISFTAFLLAVSFPLIAGYFNKTRIINEDNTTVLEMYNHSKKNDEIVPPPPPPPPPADVLANKVKFTIPLVVSDSLENGTINQDVVGNNSNNTPPPPIDSITDIDVPDVTNTIVYIKPEPFTIVEEMPAFPDGEYTSFVANNIVYPVMARESNIQGTVYVTFVVEADGSITDVKIIRGIGGGCDEEAIRVVKMMPKWIPGKQSGKNVRVQFNLPIKFTLQ